MHKKTFRVLSLVVLSIALCSLLPMLLFSDEGGKGYVEDAAHVLAFDQVVQTAQHLPYEVDIFTLPSFQGDEEQLTALASQQRVTTALARELVMVIDTAHHQFAIVSTLALSVELSGPQVRETEHVFLDSFTSHRSYTEATVITLLLLAGDHQNQTLMNGLELGASLLVFWGLLIFFSREPRRSACFGSYDCRGEE